MTGPAPGSGSIASSAGHVPVTNPSWADVRAHSIHSSAWSSHAEAKLTRPTLSSRKLKLTPISNGPGRLRSSPLPRPRGNRSNDRSPEGARRGAWVGGLLRGGGDGGGGEAGGPVRDEVEG